MSGASSSSSRQEEKGGLGYVDTRHSCELNFYVPKYPQNSILEDGNEAVQAILLVIQLAKLEQYS